MSRSHEHEARRTTTAAMGDLSMQSNMDDPPDIGQGQMDHGEGRDEDAMSTTVRDGQGGDERIDAWILARRLQEG